MYRILYYQAARLCHADVMPHPPPEPSAQPVEMNIPNNVVLQHQSAAGSIQAVAVHAGIDPVPHTENQARNDGTHTAKNGFKNGNTPPSSSSLHPTSSDSEEGLPIAVRAQQHPGGSPSAVRLSRMLLGACSS